MYTKLTLSYHKNTAFFVILIVGIFGSLLTPILNIDFASATSEEGGDPGGGDGGGGNNAGTVREVVSANIQLIRR